LNFKLTINYCQLFSFDSSGLGEPPFFHDEPPPCHIDLEDPPLCQEAFEEPPIS